MDEKPPTQADVMICSHCGWQKTGGTIQELREHAKTCVKHPMRKLEAENKRLRDTITADS